MDKKKVLLIVNPCSGKNKSRQGTFDIVDRFSSADYDFIIKTTTCQGDATNIVKNCIDDCDMVVCCGGDGTFNETINGVMQLPRRVPVGYIPAGSTNDLANTIGLPLGIGLATDAIIDGHKNSYDIGLFNNRFFTYIASFGAAAFLSYSTSQRLKNIFGHNAYIINGFLLHLPQTFKSIKPVHAKIEYDGGVIEDDFSFGSISNSTSVAGVFKFSKDDVKLDDGKFEVLLVRKVKGIVDAFGLLDQVKKMNYDGDKVIYFKTSTIKITFDNPVDWTLDGEYGGAPEEVYFSVLNRAIDIFTPENEMFLGNKIDIPVFDVADANSEEAKREDTISRFSRFKRRKKEEHEEKAEEETAEAPAEEINNENNNETE